MRAAPVVLVAALLAAAPLPVAAAPQVLDASWRVDAFEFDEGFRIAPAAMVVGDDALVALACARHGPASLFVRWPGIAEEGDEARVVRVRVEGFGAYELRMQLEGATLAAPVYDWTSETPTTPVAGTVVPEGLTDALARGRRAVVAADGDDVLDLSLDGSLRAIRELRASCP